MLTAPAAATNSPWIAAHFQGCLIASGWLYTEPGEMAPIRPWWTATYATAIRNGIQSSYRASRGIITKK